eukprot:365681-Chlamydomonas_euryale.AAC.4
MARAARTAPPQPPQPQPPQPRPFALATPLNSQTEGSFCGPGPANTRRRGGCQLSGVGLEPRRRLAEPREVTGAMARSNRSTRREWSSRARRSAGGAAARAVGMPAPAQLRSQLRSSLGPAR